MSASIYTQLQPLFRFSNQGLNVLGYVPGISSLSGTVRLYVGVIMVIAGIGAKVLSNAIAKIARKCKKDSSEDLTDPRLTNLPFDGGAHIARGFLETLQFGSLMKLNEIVLTLFFKSVFLIWDHYFTGAEHGN